MRIRDKQKNAYEPPLIEYDIEEITLGCRHTNPDICKSADVLGICAFVRDYGVCLQPGHKWKKK